MHKLKAYFFFTALLIAPSAASADLLYSHDAAGNPTTGDLAALSAAIREGAQISVSYESGGIFWARQCSSASIYNGVVSCYITGVLDTTDGGGARTFDSPRAIEAHIYDTTGYRAAIKKNFFTGAEMAVDPFETEQALQWYSN